MPTILLSAPYMLPSKDRFVPILEHYGCKVILPDVHERLSENEILTFAGQFDGVICGDDRFSAHVLDACVPRLKVISKWGTGIDSIAKEHANSISVQVCFTPNAFTLPVADTVLGYMLTFARRLPWMDQGMKMGGWQKIPGRSLSECTLGVIGVGNIGKAVLRRARGFGMKVLGNDILPIAPDFLLENGVEMVALNSLLQRSDFVSINCTLNPTSLHLIDRKALALLQPQAVLINTARGPIVSEPDLILALQQNRLAGAALDVFEEEPLPSDSPLLKMQNVLLAPHNSNSSPSAWERVHWNTIYNLLEGLNIAHPDFEAIKSGDSFKR
jgi:D-3-phosphoglycerate dehydrogenase / 2-oxoglutarate reductase